MNNNIIRQIVLDTETTGINTIGIHFKGHRIIEIGAVEIINRKITGKNFHVYLNPNRSISYEAFQVHGIKNEFLLNKPNFSSIAEEFIQFIKNSELIIHNAPFDVGFINHEFNLLNKNLDKIEKLCKIVDTLKIARKMFPGKRNNLDALCQRYSINTKERNVHGALLDAKILANIFLKMTGGQTSINFSNINIYKKNKIDRKIKLSSSRNDKDKIKIIYANKEEIEKHESQINFLKKISGVCFWKK